MNAALIIGAIWARGFIRTKHFELAAISAEAEGTVARCVLTELESGEPDRIEALKKQLQRNIQQAEEVADMWRSAAKG
ncbi:MAG: hypothetical protein JSU70_06785 [Phycisphaerales bacterium]|nr:MAG: hypothetical protein JSU70_06785 [Phycisphaerales bacterium]